MAPQQRSSSTGLQGETGDPALVPGMQASQHIQREHLLTIFEHVPAGIVYMDPIGRVLAVNPAFEQYVSRPAEVLIGERFLDLFPIGGTSLQILLEEVAGAGGTVHRQNWRFSSGSSPDAATFWDYTVCGTRDPNGTIGGLLLLITDVTDRVIEQQRAREAAADQVLRTERLSTLGTLTSAIGHELRNPLGIIQNAARALGQRPEEPERVRRLAATVEAETQRATKVITDLLDFARVRAPRRHAVGIPGLVAETLHRVGVPESIPVECVLAPDLPLLRLDGQQMGQVLENLVRNAVEAMPAGGAIRIEAQMAEGHLELRVTDDGAGVLPEDRERIFEPLFTTKRSGTGIGLAISKRLVEAHGGVITMETAPGQGTAFTVRLPLEGSIGGR
jgi:two-component system, NtrC family, sensor histidine kinase AtoS